jgi:tetratricopeptide (TPR) repeat protein
VARTSSFSFKGQNVDVPTIARKLNVGAILEGSVREAGNTVRITVQLINTVSGFHMWSQTYDRKLTDILKVQAEVAFTVAQQLEAKLVGDEAARLALGGTKNADAYGDYLRAMELNHSVDPKEADHRRTLAALDEAISLDPNFAMVHARRASTLDAIYYTTSDVSARASLNEQARLAAERAVAIAPQLGEAHHALAITYLRGTPDLTQAGREFYRSVALSPGSAWVQGNTGWFACWLGRFDFAVAAVRRAVTLDPQNVRLRVEMIRVLIFSRRYNEAQVAVQEAQMLAPNSHQVEAVMTQILIASGRFEQARKACESGSTPLDEDDRHYCLALVYHALSRQADAERELDLYKATDGDAAAYFYAEIYAQFGNKVSALHWLAEAERTHDAALPELRVDPFLDPIRNEPEFKTIEARLNFPP